MTHPGRTDIAVIAGSARLGYASWSDLVAEYGADPASVTVPKYFFDGLPTAPADGTLLRDAGDRIWKYVASSRSRAAGTIDDGPLLEAVSVPSGYVDDLPITAAPAPTP